MKWHVFIATALLFLVLLACRNRTPIKTYDAALPAPTATLEPPPVDESADNAIVTKKIKMIETIGATKLPPITTVVTLKPKGPKPLVSTDYGTQSNAAVVDSKTIPAISPDHQLMPFESLEIWPCSHLARGEKTSIDQSDRDRCKAFRYLVVVRFGSRVDAKVVGDNGYIAGHASGDATVFDLDSGERLGAVPFATRNTAGHVEGLGGKSILKTDLEGQVGASVKDAIESAWGS